MIFANARMYAVNAAVADAWRALLEWVIRRAGVPGEVIDYPAPAPLPTLWARPEMGCAFMCGYPIATARHPPRLLAAPVPVPARYGDAPVYCTDIVVRGESTLRQLPDIFGRRFAFTTVDSQSGYQAPRRFFAPFAPVHGGQVFDATMGPLVTPRRVVEALLAGEVDAVPLDSYFHDLLRAHEPSLAAQLRVLASTPMTPIPALVGASNLPQAQAERLTTALLAVADANELATVRETLLLRRFDALAMDAYASLRVDALAADRLGYRQLA